jgi:hypothetical protein
MNPQDDEEYDDYEGEDDDDDDDDDSLDPEESYDTPVRLFVATTLQIRWS